MKMLIAGAALYSKAFLQLASAPMLLTLMQAALGSLGSFLWLSKGGRQPVPSLSGGTVAVLAVILTHFVGTALTNVSTLFSSASFVNTIKAADPLFAVVFARLVLGQRFSALTHLSLVIIVVGIIIACTTEFKFEFNGFWTVMLSNACFPLRAIYTKKLLTESPTPLSGQTIFFWLSFTTLLVSIPFSLYEFVFHREAYTTIAAGGLAARYLGLAVLMHYGYNALSFILVAEVQPLTYSIGNSVKRLVTIYGSILYFRNPVSTFNLASSAVAVAGVFLYSWEEERVRKAKLIASAKTSPV